MTSKGDDRFTGLLPELCVSNLDESIHFWCELCGFSVVYDRPEDRFAYLERERVCFMLEECGSDGGSWATGVLEKPYGRGINFQIEVSAVGPILQSLKGANWPIFKAVHDAWYRSNDIEVGCRQFLIQDPDGYLLRFSEDLGDRPVEK